MKKGWRYVFNKHTAFLCIIEKYDKIVTIVLLAKGNGSRADKALYGAK